MTCIFFSITLHWPTNKSQDSPVPASLASGLQAHSRGSSHLWLCALVSEGKEGVRMHMHPQCDVEVKEQLWVLRISLGLSGLYSKHLYPWSPPSRSAQLFL